MSGLTFHRTEKYKEVVDYYKNQIGMDIWLEQGGCTILQKGNFLLGFCNRSDAATSSMITFFFETREEVDRCYELLGDKSTSPPKENELYRIYHFFTKDPEGRDVEFQTFLHRTRPYMEGTELLRKRRSIRKFSKEPVPVDILKEIFEQCRYVPTSCNSQAYFFKVIENKDAIEQLARIRGASSAPIREANCSIVCYVDTSKTGRAEQDGAIASTYFLLAAAQYGVGTCWIGGMDRDDVRELCSIEPHMHISMVSPLGWPEERKSLPVRRTIQDFVEGL